MKVFIVLKQARTWNDDPTERIVGVFASEQLACEFISTRKKPDRFRIREHEVFENLNGCNRWR